MNFPHRDNRGGMSHQSSESCSASIKVVPYHSFEGGAWKVAYADFVTAMMAFFLLLWLLNVTTDEEKNAISSYFDPSHERISENTSGAGGLLGGLTMSPQGAMADNKAVIAPQPSPRLSPDRGKVKEQKDSEIKKVKKDEKVGKEALEKARQKIREQENKEFKTVQETIKQAISEDPELKALSKNILIDMTPEGLRIQIVDDKGESMFPSGSARMFEKTKKLMDKMTQIIQKTDNQISVRGHTDSTPYGSGAEYTNWELSTDRANASRRAMLDAGFPAERINNVVGKADTEHLVPDDPASPRNRRISVVLLREELTNPDFEKKVAEGASLESGEQTESDSAEQAPAQIPIGTFRRTPGKVQFP